MPSTKLVFTNFRTSIFVGRARHIAIFISPTHGTLRHWVKTVSSCTGDTVKQGLWLSWFLPPGDIPEMSWESAKLLKWCSSNMAKSLIFFSKNKIQRKAVFLMNFIPDLSHRWQITYYIIIITINNAFEKWKNNVNVENWSSTSKGFLYHTQEFRKFDKYLHYWRLYSTHSALSVMTKSVYLLLFIWYKTLCISWMFTCHGGFHFLFM